MVLGLLLGLICATKGWRTDEPTVLPGLFIVSLSSDGLEAMHDGLVTAEFQSPGFTSEVFDDSAVLAFRMWTAPNWKNDTLYIVVMGSSMHVIPLFYSSLPDPDAAKRISESLVLEKGDVVDFWIGFDCIINASDTVQIQLRPYDGHNSPLEIFFRKACPKGPRRDLSLWIDGQLAAVGGVADEEWMTKGKELMGAVDVMVEIESGNLMISKVMASGSIPVDVRGPGARGGLLSNRTMFTIFPDCRSEVQSGTVYLTIRLQPYEDVHLLWTQVCYRPLIPDPQYTRVNVGSQSNFRDIVTAGVTQGNYTRGQRVRASTFSSTFFMLVNSSVSPKDIRLTYDSHILMPRVACTDVLGEFACRLAYRCYNLGESTVVVTLPTSDGNVEFSYLKACKQPRVIVGRGDSLSPYLIWSGLGLSLVICFVGYRNKFL